MIIYQVFVIEFKKMRANVDKNVHEKCPINLTGQIKLHHEQKNGQF